MNDKWINKGKLIAQAIGGFCIIIIILCIVWIIKKDVDYKKHGFSYEKIGDKAQVFINNCELIVDGKINDRMNYEQVKINKYSDIVINYKFGDSLEVVDKENISKWVSVENEEIILDEQQVAQFIDCMAQKYDTVGKERDFVNSYGEKVTVSGGTYGWKIDVAKETKELCELIKAGKSVECKNINYLQEAMVEGANDIGNTYIEVNIPEQKMWYYKEGELIVETDIVTGNYNRGRATPTVVGYIYNKARNRNLIGSDYVAFVRYWMKVYGSIGIHDASWRSSFGGNIYASNGSHGCINTPYENVKKIFDTVEIGTPVVIFGEE